MSSLQVKYRPQELDEFFGNEELIESLENLFKRDKKDLPHSFLFTGISGGGKTTLAFIISKMLGCEKSEIKYFNSADDRGIDFVRGIREDMSYSPMFGKIKVYIFDECHKITSDALSAMLLMTENPPEHVYFILCTSEPIKLSEADKRRLHIYNVEPIDFGELESLLGCIIENENIENFPENIIPLIIENSNGSAGIAVKLLDQIMDVRDNYETVKKIIEQTSTENDKDTIDLCRLIVTNKLDSEQKWTKCKEILKKIKKEPEYVRYGILAYLNKVMLNNGNQRIALIMECFEKSYFYTKHAGLTLSVYTACFTE